MRCRPPISAIIVVSAVVSSFISILAGYLLYAKAVEVLHSTVEETSRGTSRTCVAGLYESIEKAQEQVEALKLRWFYDPGLRDQGDMAASAERLHFAMFSLIRPTNTIGMMVMIAKDYPMTCDNTTEPCHPDADPTGYARLVTYYDPVLQDDGSWDRIYKGIVSYPQMVRENNMTAWDKGRGWTSYYRYYDSKTGDVVRWKDGDGIQNDSLPGRMHKRFHGTEGPIKHNGDWNGPKQWFTDDGTAFTYLVNFNWIRAGASRGFPEYNADVRIFVGLWPWQLILSKYRAGEERMVVLDRPDPKKKIDPVTKTVRAETAYAHNLFESKAHIPAMRHDCEKACSDCLEELVKRDCRLPVTMLGETVTAAAKAAKSLGSSGFGTVDLPSTHKLFTLRYGPRGTGNTTSYKIDATETLHLAAGKYFIRTEEIHGMGFWLLWIKSVRSTSEEVDSAFLQLVVCCAIIFAVDFVISVTEYFWIARPLLALSSSVSRFAVMELGDAERLLSEAVSGTVVYEVIALAESLLAVAASLRDYKAFIPESTFRFNPKTNPLEHPGDTPDHQSNSSSDCVRRRQSVPHVLCVISEVRNSVVAAIKGIAFGSEEFEDQQRKLIEAVHDAVAACKGTFHGFGVAEPGTFHASWNVASACLSPAIRACRCLLDLERKKRVCAESQFNFSNAAVYGCFRAGNIGSRSHRGYTVTGQVPDTLGGLHSLARHFVEQCEGVSAVSLISSGLEEKILGAYTAFPVALLACHGMHPEVVYCLSGSQHNDEDLGDEEWMYRFAKEDESRFKPHALAIADMLNSENIVLPSQENMRHFNPIQQVVAADLAISRGNSAAFIKDWPSYASPSLCGNCAEFLFEQQRAPDVFIPADTL